MAIDQASSRRATLLPDISQVVLVLQGGGARPARHFGGLDYGMPRGVRRHMVEQGGKPVTGARRTLAISSVVRFSVPLTIRKTRSASRRRASSATVSAVGQRVATWSSQQGWSGDSRPEFER
jgi:hypothetical protein